MTILIEGFDSSHWQGKFTPEIAAKMYAAGLRFGWVKVCQGPYYKDDCRVNVPILQDAGFKIGAYIFVTNDNAALQFENFEDAAGDYQYDLPPLMDCEAYTAINGGIYTKREIELGLVQLEPSDLKRLQFYGYTYPTYAIVDSIGGRASGKGLVGWMKNQKKLTGFPYPWIYTNASSGNVIFTPAAQSMNVYGLDVANWGVKLPNLPSIWAKAGKPYAAWQNFVIKDATDYGLVNTALDHQVWGDQFPFPGDVTPPPPPPPEEEDYFDVVATHSSGKVYEGRLSMEA